MSEVQINSDELFKLIRKAVKIELKELLEEEKEINPDFIKEILSAHNEKGIKFQLTTDLKNYLENM